MGEYYESLGIIRRNNEKFYYGNIILQCKKRKEESLNQCSNCYFGENDEDDDCQSNCYITDLYNDLLYVNFKLVKNG